MMRRTVPVYKIQEGDRKERSSCSSFLSATVGEPEDADRDSSVREEAESQRARSR